MKIYFSASKTSNQKQSQIIIDILEHLNHDVFSRMLSKNTPSINDTSDNYRKKWLNEWSTYIRECDCAIIECSYPSSAHIGYEISEILNKGKPVILLYHIGNNPLFIDSNNSPRLIKSSYDDDDIKDVIDWCLLELDRISNKRFTLNISPQIDAFIDKKAKQMKISRSEYVRSVIVEKMDGELD